MTRCVLRVGRWLSRPDAADAAIYFDLTGSVALLYTSDLKQSRRLLWSLCRGKYRCLPHYCNVVVVPGRKCFNTGIRGLPSLNTTNTWVFSTVSERYNGASARLELVLNLIRVLKDASGNIYGSKAAGGVSIIETKRVKRLIENHARYVYDFSKLLVKPGTHRYWRIWTCHLAGSIPTMTNWYRSQSKLFISKTGDWVMAVAVVRC